MLYQTWLLRHVPDTARGEFRNIGVVVGRDGGDWAMRTLEPGRRSDGYALGAFRPSLDELRGLVSAFETPDLLDEGISETRMDLLARHGNNALQFADPTPLVAQSAAEGADFVFEQLVARPSTPRSKASHELRADLGALLRRCAARHASDRVHENVQTRIGRAGDTARFDYAYEGEDGVSFLHPWSFDLADLHALEERFRSWAFGVLRLRGNGGTILLNGGERAVPPDSPITLVHDTPRMWRQRDSASRREQIHERTLDSLHELDVRTVAAAELDEANLSLVA